MMDLISKTFLQNFLFKSFRCYGRNIPEKSVHTFHRLYLWFHFFSSLNTWFISVRKLTHWSRVTPICVKKLATISSDNGLSPVRCQAITWTNGGVLWIGPLNINFSEISMKIQTFSFKEMRLNVSFEKCRPISPGLIALANILAIGFVRWHV